MGLARTVALGAVLALSIAESAEAVDRFVDEDGMGSAPCTSSANPCPTVATGLIAAGVGDTVFVGGGIYNESVTVGISKSIVASNFNPALTADGPSVIDGGASIAVDLPGYGAEGPNSLIQGLTLRSTTTAVRLRSFATLRDNTFDSADGLNVLAEDPAVGSLFGAVIDDNSFVDPGASGNQTAIQATTVSSVQVTGNSFTGFSDGVSTEGGSPQILGNTFSGMHPRAAIWGTAIRVSNGTPLVAGNLLNRPTGTNHIGIDLDNATTATLRRNRIFGWGVGVKSTATSVSMNGDVVLNGATFALYLYDSPGGAVNDGDIGSLNVTLAGYPKQARIDNANLTLRNSIVGDVPSGPAIDRLGGDLPGSCSLFDVRGPVEGGAATSCNNFALNDDPGFVDLAGDDAHLQADSAMIDLVGHVNDQPDIDGDARPTRGRDADNTCAASDDLGADEYSPASPFCAAPETTITAGPSGNTQDTTPTFEFSSSKLPSTFECSVDQATFVSCTSPFTSQALGAGAHSFAVRAREKHGVVDDTPSSRPFSVGGNGPGGPGGPAGGGSAFGATTRVTLGLAAKRIAARGPVRVRCSNANGFLVTGRLFARSRKRRIKLPSRSFRLQPDATTTVRLKLPKRLRRLFVREGKLSLRLTAKVTDPLDTTRTVTKRVSPRLKKKPSSS